MLELCAWGIPSLPVLKASEIRKFKGLEDLHALYLLDSGKGFFAHFNMEWGDPSSCNQVQGSGGGWQRQRQCHNCCLPPTSHPCSGSVLLQPGAQSTTPSGLDGPMFSCFQNSDYNLPILKILTTIAIQTTFNSNFHSLFQ